MLNVPMLSVIILDAIVLIVVAPTQISYHFQLLIQDHVHIPIVSLVYYAEYPNSECHHT